MRYPRLNAVPGLAAVHPGRARGLAVPPLVAVAHGSTDPRAAAAIAGLMRLASEAAGRRGLPVPETRTAFLGHAPPSVGQVLSALADQDRGPRPRHVVVLPLLLTAAYHSEADLPALLGQARGTLPGLRISYGEPLGPHPLLLRALDRRLAECGAPAAPGMTGPGSQRPDAPQPGRGQGARGRPLPRSPRDIAVVLASAGSSRPAANAAIARIAARWQAARGWRAVVPAYAAASALTPGQAVAALLRDGAPCVLVATYLLAPGVFADQVAAAALRAGAAGVSGALGAAPEVAELVLLRYARALAGSRRMDPAQPGDALGETGSCR